MQGAGMSSSDALQASPDFNTRKVDQPQRQPHFKPNPANRDETPTTTIPPFPTYQSQLRSTPYHTTQLGTPKANEPYNLPTAPPPMPPQLAKLPLSLIRDTRTRTRTSPTYSGGGGGGEGILPGGGYKSSSSSRRKGGAMARGGGGNKFWSPYARPPRRSKRLVVLWIGTFVLAGLFTWWVRARHGELARSYAEVLMARPGKVPVGGGE